MKTDRCIDTLGFGDVERWADDDPRREHLRDCARCQAELASYQEFVQTPDRPAAAQTELAVQAMRAAFADELRRSHHHSLRRPPRLRWPLLAASAVAAVALIAFLGPWRETESLGPLRTGEPVTVEFPATVVTLGAVVRLPDGRLEFSWQAYPDADHYRLQVFDATLREVGSAITNGVTKVQIPRADLANAAQPGAPLAWQVEALRQGARIAISPLAAFPMPAN